MSSDTMEVTLNAYQVIEKTATATGSSAHVFVPKEWAGKKVKVFSSRTDIRKRSTRIDKT